MRRRTADFLQGKLLQHVSSASHHAKYLQYLTEPDQRTKRKKGRQPAAELSGCRDDCTEGVCDRSGACKSRAIAIVLWHVLKTVAVRHSPSYSYNPWGSHNPSSFPPTFPSSSTWPTSPPSYTAPPDPRIPLRSWPHKQLPIPSLASAARHPSSAANAARIPSLPPYRTDPFCRYKPVSVDSEYNL